MATRRKNKRTTQQKKNMPSFKIEIIDTAIIVGTVGAILLAVALDLALLWVERAVAPWQRRGAA